MTRMRFAAASLGLSLLLACGGGEVNPTAPAITIQPTNQAAVGGGHVTFSVTASGRPTPTFQWERSVDDGGTWTEIGGATSATYTVFTFLKDGFAQFRARAINTEGTATSGAAILTVSPLSCSVGISSSLDLVQLPPGTFSMGDAGYTASEPVHSVTIAKAFYIAVAEVTQAQWQSIMGPNNPAHFQGPPTRPLENVSYDDIKAPTTGFLDQLNAATAAVRPPGWTFRLPTEAEWEYACRAGTATAYSYGEDHMMLPLYGWFNLNASGSTYPVSAKLCNDWGLYDMHGNVLELCQDWYGAYSADAQTDPAGPATGTYRVVRGGAWSTDVDACRSGARDSDSPLSHLPGSIGFRLVLAP